VSRQHCNTKIKGVPILCSTAIAVEIKESTTIAYSQLIILITHSPPKTSKSATTDNSK
jgi:hypothetical protein